MNDRPLELHEWPETMIYDDDSEVSLLLEELNRLLGSPEEHAPPAFYWRRRLQVIRNNSARVQREITQAQDRIKSLSIELETRTSEVAALRSVETELFAARESVHRLELESASAQETVIHVESERALYLNTLRETETHYRRLESEYTKLLASSQQMQQQYDAMRTSGSWRLVRLLTRPFRFGRKVVARIVRVCLPNRHQK